MSKMCPFDRIDDAAKLMPFGAPADTKTISQLAAEYGVSLRTLRFYEDQGLLSPRRVGWARYYSNKDELRLQIILKGKKLGLPLSRIYEFCLKDTDEKKEGIALTSSQIDAQIQMLEKKQIQLAEALEELRAMQAVD